MTHFVNITVVTFLLALMGCQPAHKPFDSNAWIEGDYRERGRMSDDLLNNHPFEGISVAELEKLLGEPNDMDTSLSTKTWYLDLGWTALFHLEVHIDTTTATVDSVRVWD